MAWQNLIKFISIATLISLPALANELAEREAFYKKQAQKYLNIRQQNKNTEDEELETVPRYDLDPADEGPIEEVRYDEYVEEAPLRDEPPVESTRSLPPPRLKVGQGSNSNRSKVPMQDVTPDEKSNWGVNMDMVSGYSSNIAQFEGAPSGSFYDISPSAFFDGKLAPHLDFNIGAEFFYRGFTDSEIDDLFRTTNVSVGGEITYWTGPHTFIGVGGKTTQFDGRTIDFTSPQNRGRDSRLSINDFRLFWGKDWSRAFLELSAGQEYVRGKTTILDEVGNQFFPDLNQSFARIQVGRELFKDLRWDGQYTFKYLQYLDTRARLATGQVDPNWFTANKLNEMEHSFLTSLSYRELFIEGGYDYTLDRTTGAETRNTYYGHIYTPIPFGRRFTLKPEAGIRTTYYNQYIAQIFINQSATEKRNDQMTFYGAEAALDFGLIDPFFSYRHSALRSNFFIIQYEEDLFFGGLRLNF